MTTVGLSYLEHFLSVLEVLGFIPGKFKQNISNWYMNLPNGGHIIVKGKSTRSGLSVALIIASGQGIIYSYVV